MPDIKIKPQMDQPKVRVVNNTPKDASSILKKEYAARQKENSRTPKVRFSMPPTAWKPPAGAAP